jgi:hypothetical protein
MVHAVRVGGRLPDLEHQRPDGRSAHLSELWAEGPVLLIWLRHCG